MEHDFMTEEETPKIPEQTEEQPEQESTEELVELPHADDADIDAFLEKEEKADAEAANKEPKPEPQAQEQEKQEQPTEQAVKPQTPEEVEKLQKRVKDKELFIQRQAAEIGNLRKQLTEFIAAKKKGLEDRFLESPEKALDDKLDIKEAEKKLETLEKQERTLVTRALVDSHIEAEEGLMEGMVNALQRDGLDPQTISQFALNPYENATPGELIQLAKRAKAENVVRELVSMMQTLIKQNEELKSKPNRVLNKVEEALKSPPRLNGKSGQAISEKKGVGSKQISQLSDAELEELLSNS
jgi:hypothetical protein